MTELTPVAAVIRAEVSADDDRAAVTGQIIPALQALVTSLEIPVRVETEIVDGAGRVRIGDVSPRFAAIIAPGAELLRADDVSSYAGQFISLDVARHLWREWHPERASEGDSPRLMSVFRRMLRDAVMLGFRLGRFRDAFGGLTVDAPDAAWEERFEEAIAAPDCPRVRLFLSDEQYEQLVVSTRFEKSWSDHVQFMNDGLFVELGIVFPTVSVLVDQSLTPPFFRCEWNDLQRPPQLGLHEDELLVNDTPARLNLVSGHLGRDHENPATRQPAAVTPRSEQALLEASGLTTWDAKAYLILAIAAELRVHAASFVTGPWVEFTLLRLEQIYPQLLQATRARFTMLTLVRTLRELAAEQIDEEHDENPNGLLMVQSTLSVDPRRVIAMPLPGTGTHITTTRAGSGELSSSELVEVARHALTREIAKKASRGTNTLVVYLFDGPTERRLAASSRLTSTDCESLLDALADEMRHLPPTAQRPVLMVSADVRARLRDELFPEYSRLSVVCLEELPPQLNIQPVARISPNFS